ncbi:MAG TPA: hypothetical protein EYH03_00250 [Chromatiales bacterium]|nr:hypothetical protein [Chromatiales bacterium]
MTGIWITLAPLLPMLAALWIGIGYLFGWNRGEAGERETARVAQGAAFASLLLILGWDLMALASGAPGQVVIGPWLASGEYQVDISFNLDTLGLSMATLVAFIALLTIRFSVNYLHREAGFQRFFMILSLFTGAMLLIVTAGSSALVFIGWELAGVSSYLLIAYSFKRPVAAGNATRAFVTNRIGDAAFVLAIYLSFEWLGDAEWPALTQGAAGLETLNADLLALAFLIAALAKSAQVPFAPWIARALEGPTPSSAIFYGSLMVHAGAYLMIRLAPLFEAADAVAVLLAVLGLLTAFYGWLVGLVQTDVKSSFMFATTAQVGLIFLWCGLGWYDLAAWHLALHALWRAYQFLHAPAFMHMVSRPVRTAPGWLTRSRTLHTAALQRLWLDPLSHWLLVKPTQNLAEDVNRFDDRIVSRIVGVPAQASAVSSLAEWEERRLGLVRTEESDIGRGQGVLGVLMEKLAEAFHWFEEHLVLQSEGQLLQNLSRHVGRYLLQIEELLTQPRYLLLLIMATIVVIL